MTTESGVQEALKETVKEEDMLYALIITRPGKQVSNETLKDGKRSLVLVIAS